MKRLFLIDGYALAYRAYFAFIRRPLMNSKGQNTSAIFGFVNTLLRILRTESPDYIAVVFDSREPTFRHKEFKEYKATREKMPEDMLTQLEILRELVSAFNIPLIELPGYEADDIIGTLAHIAENKGIETYLVTGDKDFMQLVSETIKIYKPGKRSDEIEIIDSEAVRKKFGISPEQVVEVFALMGDSSDNIPGVPGIGEKTAIPLIQQYGTLENLLSNVDTIERKAIQQKLRDHKDDALLSKKLVTIDTNVPLDVSIEELTAKEWDKVRLRQILSQLEFKSILEQLNLDSDTGGTEGGTAQNIASRRNNYQSVETPELFETMCNEILSAEIISFDTETTSQDPLTTTLVGISFSVRDGEAWFIPFHKHSISEEDLRRRLRDIFTGKQLKGGQNIKFDILALKSIGIDVRQPLFDTMIASYIVRPDRQHNLDSLAREYLGYEKISYTDLVGHKKNQIDIRDVDPNTLMRYACEDADITLQVWKKLRSELENINASKLCTEIEFPLIEVLAAMEHSGVAIDTAFLRELSKHMSYERRALREKIVQEAGVSFNINSTQQLSRVLFEELGLPPVKKTKTGFSTDTSVLERLKGVHPIVELILEYRQLTKLQTTYVDALPKLINQHTGKVHTSFNQTITQTGRLSSSNPNLQNIPIRTELGKSIRKAFIPSSSKHVIMSSDYSQIELRIMAHLSKDEGLLAAFHNKEDIHATTAAKIFDVPFEEVTPLMRRKAKEVNFGIIYGISPYGLAARLEISQSEAAQIIEKYFHRFPKVYEFIRSIKLQARKDGYVSTLMGRRRYLPDIGSRNKTVRQNAERQAINMPIQGTAADMIKLAMVRIHERLRQQHLNSKMIIQVHDELVFDVRKDELDEVRSLVEHEMIHALTLEVPVEVATGVGNNWFEAH